MMYHLANLAHFWDVLHLLMVSVFFVILKLILVASLVAVLQHFAQVLALICSSAKRNTKERFKNFCMICFR
jgi:hypothetical protein